MFQVWWFLRRPHTRGVKLVIRRGSDVLFVRHSYGDRTSWELPGGGLKNGEDLVGAARREAREELGVDPDHWVHIGDFEARDHATARLSCLTASYTGEELSLNLGELEEARWAPAASPPEPLGRHAVAALALLGVEHHGKDLDADPAGQEFRFCPLCARPLARLQAGLDANRLGCPQHHFVHYDNPAITVFAFLEHDGRFLILKRAHGPCLGEWDVPGGFVEAGEQPRHALRREVLEETTLEIENVRMIGTYTSRYGPGGKKTVDIGFHCRLSGGELQISEEKSEARWVALDQCPRFAFDGQNAAVAQLNRERSDTRKKSARGV